MGSSEVCAYCRRRPVDPAFRPFCSERCKMADLGRWLGGEYRVAGERPTGDADPDHPESPADIPTQAGFKP
jgi:endogenous inhibitor of DNA gyrase (YacG/DUF329 family)